MSKLYQIYEDDLADLERTLPQFQEALTPHLNARLRTQIRRVQNILSNVRWNYGPPEQFGINPCGGEKHHEPDGEGGGA